jgi:hypothetical protein
MIDARRQHASDVDAGEVVRHQVRGLLEPEIADPAQHLALAGDRVRQHHVERAEAVGGDNQQLRFAAVFGQLEHIAHLAAMAQGQAGEIGGKESGRHRISALRLGRHCSQCAPGRITA